MAPRQGALQGDYGRQADHAGRPDEPNAGKPDGS
jgi:hypothetical protein